MKLIILHGEETESKAFDVLNYIIKKDGTFNAINTFVIDDETSKNKNSNVYYRYNVSYNDMQSAFRNNAIVYCSDETPSSNPVHGIMSDEWENGNIVCVSFGDFNKIHSRYLTDSDIVTVWLSDNNIYYNKDKHSFKEQQYALTRIESENIPCLYYNIKKENVEDISNTSLKYINESDETLKSIILKENS